MGVGGSDPPDDDPGSDAAAAAASGAVFCSICLDPVKPGNGDRSTARLHCGHEFHLDCIGSAFNAKGLMQCPNCRKVEKGQWLYANGTRSFPEFNIDDWPHDEDLYDLGYPELPFGVHWCPFSSVSRLASFMDGELQTITYHHDLTGHQSVFTQQSPASSDGHSCPYLAYLPLQPSSSSNPTGNVAEAPAFVNHHHHFHHQHNHHPPNGHSDLSDISLAQAFAAVDHHYQGWDQHPGAFSVPNNDADQTSFPSGMMRPRRLDADGLPRAAPFGHPFLLGHGGHPRMHGFRSHHQQLSTPPVRPPLFSGSSRSNAPRNGTPMGSTSTAASNQSSFFVFPVAGPTPTTRTRPDADNSAPRGFYAWERDRFAPYPLAPVEREPNSWSSVPQSGRGSDGGSAGNAYWHRHGSERSSSQGRTENPSHHMMHPFI